MPSTFTTLAALAAASAVAAGAAIATASDDSDVTVVKIVDGDTLDVRYDGDTHRVRLLNIDTPEVGGNDKDEECLAAEATEFLRTRLPVGSSVALEWDEDHEDRYGRQLRGVFDDTGFVNADIVRQGLAVPMHIDPNHRYKAEIDEAYAAASRSEQVLFDPAHDCTLVARTNSVNDAVRAKEDAAAVAEAAALRSLLRDPDSFASRMMSDAERTVALSRLGKVIDGHSLSQKKTAPAAPEKTPAPQPSSSESPASAPSTSTPPPAPETTPAPAPTTQSTPPPPAPVTTSTAVPQPAQPRPQNAAPCRSYAPGGKTFTYIDCDTKLPL